MDPVTPMNNNLKRETSVKSPGVRRIHADIRELHLNKSRNYAAKPCEDDLYDWHFVIRGPEGTDFDGGRYHGRIILPPDYPFKPPHIIFLTPNGRWEIGKRICLSISSYHPEEWSAAWGIRTVLEALISMMPTPAEGAVGGLDVPGHERKKLASLSLKYKHQLMPELPEEGECDISSSSSTNLPKFFVHGLEPSTSVSASSTASSTETKVEQQEEQKVQEPSETVTQQIETQQPLPQSQSAPPVQQLSQEIIDIEEDLTDKSLRYISWGLVFAILAIAYRKMLISYAAIDLGGGNNHENF